MKIKKLALAIAAISSTAIFCSSASAKEIEGNIALSSEYVFRGISQSDEDPALSGGFDYGFDNGVYLGIWGSNVDFGSESNTSTEIDLYAGYAFDLTDNINLDLSAVYFVFPDETDELNYSEYIATLGVGNASFGLVFSPDYLGSDAAAIVVNADYSFSLTSALSLDLHVGYTVTDDEDDLSFEDDDDDYVDYSIGLSAPFKGVDLSLTFHNTDIDSGDLEDLADERVVFSIAKSF